MLGRVQCRTAEVLEQRLGTRVIGPAVASQMFGAREGKLASQAEGLVRESGFGAFRGKPVAAVQAGDLKRVWSFLNEQAHDTRFDGGTAVNIRLLAETFWRKTELRFG